MVMSAARLSALIGEHLDAGKPEDPQTIARCLGVPTERVVAEMRRRRGVDPLTYNANSSTENRERGRSGSMRTKGQGQAKGRRVHR